MQIVKEVPGIEELLRIQHGLGVETLEQFFGVPSGRRLREG